MALDLRPSSRTAAEDARQSFPGIFGTEKALLLLDRITAGTNR
jgi:hypothetical protein